MGKNEENKKTTGSRKLETGARSLPPVNNRKEAPKMKPPKKD